MKNLFFTGVAICASLASCQPKATKDAVADQKLSAQAIAIHDEIMPQISAFDKTSILVDSLLGNLAEVKKNNATIDTAIFITDLKALKSNIEAATDNMMTWMKDYNPDSTDIAYQEAEIAKIKAMKKQFDDVNAERNKKLADIK